MIFFILFWMLEISYRWVFFFLMILGSMDVEKMYYMNILGSWYLEGLFVLFFGFVFNVKDLFLNYIFYLIFLFMKYFMMIFMKDIEIGRWYFVFCELELGLFYEEWWVRFIFEDFIYLVIILLCFVLEFSLKNSGDVEI